MGTLVVCCLALAPALGAQTLKIGTIVPEGSVWDKALRQLGSQIREQSSERVKFVLYPGGVAGDEPDLVRKMRIGQLQGALMSLPGLADIDPAFNLFQVPLLFEDDAEVLLVLERLRPALEKRLADKGFVLLHWGHSGWLRIFASKPIRNFEDFRNLKQFVWGTDTRTGKWYQELGLRPVSLSATDVLTGLQTGLIEALPVTPLAALALQWFRSAPYMIDHRFAPLLGATVVTQASWNKLEPADRERLLALARETEARLMREVPAQESAALSEMQARGLTIVQEPASDGTKWVDLGRAFEERFRGAVPAEIFDEALAQLEAHRKAK